MDTMKTKIAARNQSDKAAVDTTMAFDELTQVQKKQLNNVDEALLKSFLFDPRGCDPLMVDSLLQGNLQLEIDAAIRILSKDYPQ